MVGCLIQQAAGWDNRVRVYTWPKAKPLAILETHTSAVNALAWSPPLQVRASARCQVPLPAPVADAGAGW